METLLTIWINPAKTFENLNKLESEELEWELNILFYLGALSLLIPRMVEEYKLMDRVGIIFMIMMLFVSAFIGALILKYIYVFTLWLVGKLLQGKATKFQVRVVLAYSMIPGLISLFISFVLIIIAIIIKDINIIGYQNPIALFVIWIFGIRTLIIGLAKYNGFSYGYALINIFLVAGLLNGTLYLIKYLVK